MNIENTVLESLKAIGFTEPTRIQAETIPLIKEGHDVIGQSETGSGKTGAFGIPLVEKVVHGEGVQALVLAPTRELALQICGEIEKFSRRKGLNIQCIYGGVSMGPQISGLRRADIVVGTPGRVLDHLNRGTMDLQRVKTFILDEADKMIDMGFIEDIETIERLMPNERQTLLFSATMPASLIDMRERFTKNAVKVATETKVKEESLKQYFCDVDRNLKFSLLVHLLRQEDPDLAIIFCNSRRDVDSVCRNLRSNRINADALHGGLSQNRREQVIDTFHNRMIDVLVATDVAARGLDFKKVTHIFNYSVPVNTEEYVNRIGRTARAGESGKAIVLLSREDYDSFNRVVNTYNFEIQPMEYSNVEVLPFARQSSNWHNRDGDRRGDGFHRDRRQFRRSYDGYNGNGNGNGNGEGNGRKPFNRSFSGGGESHSCANIDLLQNSHRNSEHSGSERSYSNRRRRYN
jgi:ATP-dependent RNA helicase DeaD